MVHILFQSQSPQGSVHIHAYVVVETMHNPKRDILLFVVKKPV